MSNRQRAIGSTPKHFADYKVNYAKQWRDVVLVYLTMNAAII